MGHRASRPAPTPHDDDDDGDGDADGDDDDDDGDDDDDDGENDGDDGDGGGDDDGDSDGDDGVDDEGDNDGDDVIGEHLLTVLLIDRVAHLARIRLTFFHCKSTTVSMSWLCWWNKKSKTDGIYFSKFTFDYISRFNLVHCGTPGWLQGDTLRE